MKAEEFRDALALIAESDRRATATMIENVVAAVLLKLAPPEGGAVATITLTPADIESLYETHYFETSYDAQDGLTLHLTPLSQK